MPTKPDLHMPADGRNAHQRIISGHLLSAKGFFEVSERRIFPAPRAGLERSQRRLGRLVTRS